MTRKRRRLYLVLTGLVFLLAAAGLVAYSLEENLSFFFSPSELQAKQLEPGQRFRLGGLVADGSKALDADGLTHLFKVTDGNHTIAVRYKGILPDLFREGQGVVAEGSLNADRVFVATEVLAKHDENYMPKEVADALKKSDHWQGEKGAKGDKKP